MIKDRQFFSFKRYTFTMRLILFTVILLFVTSFQFKQEETLDNLSLNPPFYDTNTVWVDSVMQALTTDQRIAQLFMVAAYSNKGRCTQGIYL